jgi:signal transduction histidine kinase
MASRICLTGMLGLLCLLRLTLLQALAEPAAVSDPITQIGVLRAMPRELSSKSLPVHVRGVVTFHGPREQITLQDETGGSWLLIAEARRDKFLVTDDATLKSIRVGHVLDVEGVSDPGSYAPGIRPRKVRILGEQPLPSARPLVPSRFFRGAEAGLRVEVHGVVQGFEPAEQGWELKIDADPGRFTAEVPQSILPNPAAIVDAEVRITGVAVTRVNSRGEITMPRVYSSQPDELVIERPATPPFAAPLVHLDQLLPFRPEPSGPHRKRVVGVVTYSLPGKFLYLQEGTSAVRVETPSMENFRRGDRVEASGFVDMTRHVGMLTEAQLRKIGDASAPPAVDINPEDIIALNNAAIRAVRLAQPHDFDGHLIRFRASLLAVQSALEPRQAWRRLTLKRGETVFGAFLSAGETLVIDALQPGSELEVTGLVQLEYTSVAVPRVSLVPTHLDVILRSADDVVVVRAPSWWTAERLLGAVAIVAVAFGIALVWVWQLRRQVRRKAEELAVEIRARRDAAVDFHAALRERNRLAANLHDTLLQTLGGIGFQIGAGEAEAALPERAGKPIAQLAVARRILDHAVQELRSSVWALRSPSLEGKSLPEVLRLVADREGTGKSVRIEVNTDGDFGHVSEFVAGNLVFAAQEALRNALKHGAPTLITMGAHIEETPALITLVIRDDGIGFTPGNAAGANQGHFGLVGMRERIERLDGTLRVESAPGKGTTIHITVPLRSYDETVA